MTGQRVALEPDPTQDKTDRYGRTLAYLVRADGWDYSVEAARAGTAHSYVYGVIPLLATRQSRRRSMRQSMRIGVFGVRRAMATRHQFRAEVGAAELATNA